MKKLLLTAIVLSLCATFFGFSFTELVEHPLGKTIVGGYYTLMAYQVISPYPLVIRYPTTRCSGINWGPFIVVDSEASYSSQLNTVAHEREHLYQNAVCSTIIFTIFYTLESVKQWCIGHDYYMDNWFERLAYDIQWRYANGKVINYFTVSLEF